MRILMTGGGTAGHINPALAIADLLKQKYPDAEFLFVGAKGRMETQLVPAAGYPIRTVTVRGFQRRFSLKNIGRNVMAVANVFGASAASKKIIKEFKPDLAVGTGGYVCGPVLRQAIRMGVPTAVHESNAYPGVTVKMLGKEGALVLLCSEDARRHLPEEVKAVVTGNPLRPDFLTKDKETARKELGLDTRPLVLSFGGSLGAAHINEAMVEVLSRSRKEGKLQHIHGAGKAGYAAMKAQLEAAGVPLTGDGVTVREYIDDMPRCMAAADLVICRCGAMTLSELPAAGKPSILIPSPYVAENHQFHNAMVLVNRGAALCIEEKDLTADALWEAIQTVTDNPDKLAQMEQNVRGAAILDADVRIMNELEALLKK
ncbi:MAG: undecaprenyldiphospho-muramoylpentapeptide beta-N-acetylglucosaminyltransferase [Ruminococcaceae bacterium]|nr:undecaprenyldiphospho-muramoylpentapeptide beta-N-acetylglucosaminyltransferase [Oscillospiraceae bacterium]